MTDLLTILERQADGLPTQPPERVRIPFTEADLLVELEEHATACRALAEVALGRAVVSSPFELSQQVLDALGMLQLDRPDEARAAMIEDAVVVHSGGGSPDRLRRSDDWDVLFGTMDAIAGLARVLAARSGGVPSGYVRLAFDVPVDRDDSSAAPPARPRARSTTHPAGTAVPSDALARVERWAAERPCRHDPDTVDPHDVRLEVHKRGKSITVTEALRVSDGAPGDPEWVESRIAQLRWVSASSGWTLHYADRSDRWHPFDRGATSEELDDVLALIDTDPTGVFWP